MTNRKLGVLAIAAAAFAGACADPAGPSAKTLLTTPSMGVTPEVVTHPGPDPAVGVWGTVELCKTSNVAGNYQFTLSENGVASLLVTSPHTITIPAGGGTVCVDVYVSPQSVGVGGAENVTITETTNANLAEINIIQYKQNWIASYSANELDDTPTNFQPGNAATAVLNSNSDMARRVTFVNFTPSLICTYTKGWYRNNGSSTVIAVDGRTVAQAQAIFAATPGKPGGVTWGADNNNLNLYQQLLAALQNLNGNATAGPAAVDAAIAAALTATGGSGLAITVAAGTDVSGLINTLSSFNEGLFAGFPHCDD